jgi:hypothetical protein
VIDISYADARGRVRKTVFLPTFFGVFTLCLLAGYALFGKGFAYLGIPPFMFVGEIGVILGLATIASNLVRPVWNCPVTWLILLFMTWGAVCTFPYVGTYGVDSLRDAVIWGYAVYAIAVATTVLRLNAFEKVVELYGRALPFFLIISPILHAIFLIGYDALPKWPWGAESGVTLVYLKTGDLAVQYAGAFAYMTLGLSATPFGMPWLFLWVVGATPMITLNRGAMLAVASSVGLVAILRPALRYYYQLAAIVLVLGACYGVLQFFLSSGNQPTFGVGARTISFEQMYSNVMSIFFEGDSTSAALDGTKRWRQLWWAKIVDYTIYGEYFWTGKGFGANIAIEDGFQGTGEAALTRSPHNAQMTVLARSGVPGLAIWLLLHATFAITLFVNFVKDRFARRDRLAAIELWTFLYWLAFMVNGSVDVFLEGPQGGIPMWSVVGFGLALIAGRPMLLRSGIYAPKVVTPQYSFGSRAT